MDAVTSTVRTNIALKNLLELAVWILPCVKLFYTTYLEVRN